ncbi:MAG: hypothetical protein L6R28_07375 [Planctomycetes bacterium]|nr:hypothetical protein [Planctomycetota bacterium]
MKTERSSGRARIRAGGGTSRERGFILIVVVGMLAVLVVLGMSYAEQGRVELRGASNTRDLAALDGLSEVGFQFALVALHDDQNVKRAGFTPSHLGTLGGVGWTSRWGFNPDATLGGKMPAGADRAPSRADAYNFQDSWRLLLWNEETVEPVATWTGKAWAYAFKFRPGPNTDQQSMRSRETQRYPQPPSVLVDTVQLQPFARVRKFQVRVGSYSGNVQVGITPKDGGLNLNDVYDPATVNEKAGIYETLKSGDLEGTVGIGTSYDISTNATELAKVPYASPDRRTLDYILGKVPQMAQKNKESVNFGTGSEWNYRRSLAGSTAVDNGLLNWRHVFEPYGGGQDFKWAGSVTKLWINGYSSAGYQRSSTGYMTSMTTGAPTTIYNVAGGSEPNRYGLECTRHIMWTALKGWGFTCDGHYGYAGQGYLVAKNHYGNDENKDYIWFPSGSWTNDPRLPFTGLGWGQSGGDGNMYFHGADNQYQGMGFDRKNPHRAGMDATQTDIGYRGRYIYIGAGGYGHPKAHTFQLHYMNAVANGRFWTDLLAAWYFGGAPGYTNYLGATQSSGYNNWAHLGSSYDSIGMGTHWMPPTSHVWIPGFFNKGRLSTPTQFTTSWGGTIGGPATGRDEVSRGLTQWPGSMPPARMAATYLVPMARWPADFPGQSNAHFCFNNFRLTIRAHGLQENWGDPVNPGTVNGTPSSNRWYDAIDVNNTNLPVVYGMLTIEKIPSMLNRTAVAPHLHWKARMLDVECRLKTPVKPDGSEKGAAVAYDDVKNSWIPVQLGLRQTDTGKTFPGVDWDGDPDSANYNPWIPLRMKLQDPSKPWDPVNNVWEEPKLKTPGNDYDPITNPFYNSAAFLAELQGDPAKRNDYITYPWMPSLIKPVDLPGTGNIMVGLYNYGDATLLAQAAGTWGEYIRTTAGVENFPWMPIKDYGAVEWHRPYPTDGTTNYPSPGWDGYLYEPRWYTGRTVNPKYLEDKLSNSTLADISAYYGEPGALSGGGANTKHYDAQPSNFYAFASNTDFDGGLAALTGHRHIDPKQGRRNVIWGKMDFLTPEPEKYYDLAGNLVGYGTGRPMDDVFTDCHLDRGMVSMDHGQDTLRQTWEAMMARPDDSRNWHDWFNQRKRAIPADTTGVNKTTFKPAPPYRPADNTAGGTLKIGTNTYSEGKWHSAYAVAYPDPATFGNPPAMVRGETSYTRPDVLPHSIHGLPNPDYLQNFPGYPISQHWADQFRCYFPVSLTATPSAMDPSKKMVDFVDPDPGVEPVAAHTAINPAIPVPKTRQGQANTPVVPAVSKDEAWRITRLGPRYQEVIANEIMDYQLNPWWPNPCVPVSELCVPLDRQAYPSEPRAKVKVSVQTGMNRWRSYFEHMDIEPNIGSRVPKFYAYFNRFWTRTNHKAVRNWGGDPNDITRPLGEPYRAITIVGNVAAGIPDELINADEGKGMFPTTWQYFGEPTPSEETFHDRIKYFPYNAMEDQLGDDWRYLAQSVALMTEPAMQRAPGRNHPFRNWADFVAFLGHLVYRSPMDPKATTQLAGANALAQRDPLYGVDAWKVCHGGFANVDPRNKDQFFDGSRIRDGDGGAVYADCLRATIVSKEGFWPIAANYGMAPDPQAASGAAAYYPLKPATGGWTDAEWKRRWDEIRGRDEAGLRVEQHYISERAANDVLVSLSNGRIGPIDFDGDGHVTMTRGKGSVIPGGTPTVAGAEGPNVKPSGDIPQTAPYDRWDPTYYRQWQLPAGYPWHKETGADATSVVTHEDPESGPNANAKFWGRVAGVTSIDPVNRMLGIKPKEDAANWVPVTKDLIIRNCVTLPIKFHSNTFRVTVVVEVTDAEHKEVFAVRRYQKVLSRVPDTAVANVHGPFTGEFIEHSSRAMNGVDPELNWLGVK